MQHRLLIACAFVIACEPLQPVVVAEATPYQPIACARVQARPPAYVSHDDEAHRACEDVIRACESGAFYGFAPGQAVAAKWNGGAWYVANVARKNRYDYDVEYADGDRGTVRASDMIPLGGTFAVGDHVIAKWHDAAMYPGTIVRVAGWMCTVRWDDGDRPLDVPSDMIAHVP